MTKVLITGGLGYIGSVLYEVLRDEGFETDILDCHLFYEVKPAHPFRMADVRDKPTVERIIRDYDVVVNLASIVGDPACLVDTNLAIEVNCTGTRNVAEVCKELGKRIVHFSTCSIYGSEPNKVVREEDEGFPIDFYGQTKFTQERLVRDLCGELATVFRLGTAYGLSPRMRYDLVVNTFAARAVRDGKITVFGGEQERPFVHVRDASRAVVHAIRSDLRGVFNVKGQNLSLLKLGELVSQMTGCELTVDRQIVDKRSYVVDSSKLESTGFQFQHSIEDAVKEIVDSGTAQHMEGVQYSNVKLMNALVRGLAMGNKKPHLIGGGGVAVDDRGTVSFVNDFNFAHVRRFYQVRNFSTSTVRAFHGHLHEGKYVYVAKGSAIVAVVKLTDPVNPSKEEPVQRFVLSDKAPRVLFVPPGHANGFRPLEEDTRVIFFSTATLEESQGDDVRFPHDYWGESVWEVENR